MIVSLGTPATADDQPTRSTESARSVYRRHPALQRLNGRSPADRWEQRKRALKRSQPKQSPPQVILPVAVEEDEHASAPPVLTFPAYQPVTVQPESANDGTGSDPFDTESGPNPFERNVEQSSPAPSMADDSIYGEPVRDPRQLRKMSEILPYYDYQPSQGTDSDDPCQFLCPRPDGEPCKTYGPDERVPECPEELQLSDGVYEGRSIAESVFSWEASNLYHNPLYFQDAPLERYGHTHNKFIQPLVSSGKFGIQLLGLPYQMAIDPICKKVYPLGWYRPGECAPKKLYQIPWSMPAAAAQAGVVSGLILLIP